LIFCIIIDKLPSQRYHFKYVQGKIHLFRQKRRTPMNDTFRKVAALCGLRLSYYTTAAFLTIAFLILVPTAYLTASPLYILLSLALLPSVVKALFFSSETQKKREPAMAYPLFCKKFHYNFIAYRSMSISYLLLFILLAAWHISYTSHTDIPAIIRTLPALIGSLSLLTRIFGVFGYRIYFRFFPLRAMR